jgi:hypothetical protein
MRRKILGEAIWWLYLAEVIDAYSRKIVGSSMSEHHDAEIAPIAKAKRIIRRTRAAITAKR